MASLEFVTVVWRMQAAGSTVTAELWTHPIGWELRVLWDGQPLTGQAYRDIRDAQQDADETLARLEGYNRERLGQGQSPET